MSEKSNLKVIGQADEAANARINEIRSAQQAELLKMGQQALGIQKGRIELAAFEAKIKEAEAESAATAVAIQDLQDEGQGLLKSIGETLKDVEGQWFLRSDGAVVQIAPQDEAPAEEPAAEAEG